jgi:hypothetical protein
MQYNTTPCNGLTLPFLLSEVNVQTEHFKSVKICPKYFLGLQTNDIYLQLKTIAANIEIPETIL